MKYTTVTLFALASLTTATSIDREAVVGKFNPVRHASSNSTPMQVGNGNFAFGADITGLQTFQPFAIMSSWGWHNFSLPTNPGQSRISDFTGLDRSTHGKMVNYTLPNPAQQLTSTWLIQNPQRINLGRIGFWFGDDSNITETALSEKSQTLDLYSGIITSEFNVLGSRVQVTTSTDPDSDTVSIQVESDLISSGQLGIFFDYPFPIAQKFEAPFVGIWNATSKHTTTLQQSGSTAQIAHDIDATTYYTAIEWQGTGSITGPLPSSHRYILKPTSQHSNSFALSVNFSPAPTRSIPNAKSVSNASKEWWSRYWETGAFIDLTSVKSANATELQRRIILSQYLLAVNEASHDPPQESGLVNNGWYGKFHMEMVLWHSAQWARWGKWEIFNRVVPGVYERFLPTSLERAAKMGWKGARWGKMSDPSGRSAPGRINSLLIWQQPHPMYFAELEWRKFPTNKTLRKWDEVLSRSADFMADFASWNETAGHYDLGPPMYPVSENTNPSATINPTFELAYWHFGLSIASLWKSRQNLPVPSTWTHVNANLAPLPIINSTYAIYQDIPNMWIDPNTYYDHPGMTGIYGLLPPGPGFNLTVMQITAAKVKAIWDFPNLFGWDFPLLAMNAARLGDSELAVEYLLDPLWEFDDVGMPVGGKRVPTPYFPSSGGLLLAVSMLAGGWDGDEGVNSWPRGWEEVKFEGFEKAL